MADHFAELARGEDKEYFITQGDSEVLNNSLPNSSHLEADYRLVTHVLHAAQNGYTSTTVRGNDTDILIILIAFIPKVLEINKNHTLYYDHSGQNFKIENRARL